MILFFLLFICYNKIVKVLWRFYDYIYIVLLRGINISGKNKISMLELKQVLENNNFYNVKTYLNSGNIILSSDIKDKLVISNKINKIIKDKFNLDIPIFVITLTELKELLDNKPDWWGSDNKEIYDNIIFIIPPFTYKEIYDVLGKENKSLEKIYEYKNNIFWSYKLAFYRKTNWWSRTASTSIKDNITIRTAGTVKKLLELGSKE